ncbi:MAG: PepSY-like domain-containing protein [Bacteroidota bacterium]
MKHIMIALLSLFLVGTTAFSLVAKKDKIPQAVVESMKNKFPDAQKVNWEKEKSEYEASFVVNGIKTSANFKLDGTWTETESVIPVSGLPKIVLDGILAAYPDATIVGTAKIETPGKEVQYEADIQRGKKKTEILFNADGTEIKK